MALILKWDCQTVPHMLHSHDVIDTAVGVIGHEHEDCTSAEIGFSVEIGACGFGQQTLRVANDVCMPPAQLVYQCMYTSSVVLENIHS
jgi:hypothetical protein